ncbi:ArsR/SmtB family transcription factor [Paractinoplanes rhizophilus]|jgi:DNA-binding transcriptional ArsR family regulator|uniref:ArsR/SmtB family transcription factor n=1 Tax=Paractinoplanes rhizophilus TaxID=1416877 RepID=A0ABW2HS96_9ACTN|nr:winged helix-turn-helix domain-containing protein [Actinoplanes sp.]
MDNAESLAGWAALLADRTRAAFCLALLDGRAWTVGELARHAGVAVSTASEHADRLVAGGLLAQRKQGRHRYLQLAGPEVAALIETVAAAGAPAPPEPVVSLSAAHRRRNLAFARTCYDHLAGFLGVAVADAMTADGLVSRSHGLTVTPRGTAWLAANGVAWDRSSRRPVVRECLDWTERRSHLAGSVGAAICAHAFEAGWIVRIGTGRAVKVTGAGARALEDQLGVVIGPGRDSPGAAPAVPAGARPR